MKTISIFPVDSQVILICLEMQATISQVCIGSNERVTYEVVYWYDGTRRTTWVNESEFKVLSDEKRMKIGFAGQT